VLLQTQASRARITSGGIKWRVRANSSAAFIFAVNASGERGARRKLLKDIP